MGQLPDRLPPPAPRSGVAAVIARQLVIGVHLALGALLTVGAVRAAGGAVVHVHAGRPSSGPEDGAAWATAYRALGDALTVAYPGDEIWIAAGTYRPAARGSSRGATFFVPPGVALYGGFAGDETHREQRDPRRNASVLSGDLRGDDDGTRARTADNVDHVITVEAAFDRVVLDGLAVTGGAARADADEWRPGQGGAVRSIAGDVVVRDTIFHANAADLGGGAIWCFAGSLEMERCAVHSCDGGGIDIVAASAVVLRDCDFGGNDRAVAGAALVVGVDDVLVDRCAFRGNTSLGGAGALLLVDAGAATFHASVFAGNRTDGAGGAAIVEGYGAVTVTSCAFVDNIAGLLGGAVGAGSDVAFVNCLVAQNVSGGAGGAIYAAGRASFINCTIVENAGSGIVVTPGKPALDVTVTNSILWDNAPYALGAFGGGPFDGAIVVASDVAGGWFGPGADNLDADPLFADRGAGDWRLESASPCIDAGRTRLVPAGELTDLLGAPRIAGAAVDLGAYEYPATTPAPLLERSAVRVRGDP